MISSAKLETPGDPAKMPKLAISHHDFRPLTTAPGLDRRRS
jgi:hypothetical protein